ncbi:hypothetical protein BC831DRAFT_521297 [Entophlyctis helioformis]|nr:hypothetical protein BC831DRAFT_521297 [Entophlyctis helioformis]
MQTQAAQATHPAAQTVQHRIHLTNKERQIRQLLLETAAYIEAADPGREPIVLRIAGGWVRDKLLGRDSDDIDIAIDTMKGEAFAHHLKEYMQAKGLHMGTIATIQVNPDKSKHLETATARVFGLDVDFVHLRTEIYDDESRNPVVGYGTPHEDAMRRDITINALFYNLQTEQVEDLTGHGLADLQQGVIRTPLDPVQTFIDDPLRVLRVIRFATRFGYEIVPEVLVAAADERIKAAFSKKITRERVGVELDKMLRGPDPVRSIRLIVDTGFYPLVFMAPTEVAPDTVGADHLATLATHILGMVKHHHMLADLGLFTTALDDDDRRNLFLAASLMPFRGVTYKHKNKDLSAARQVVCVATKLSNMDGDIVQALLSQRIREVAIRNYQDENGLDRMTLGWCSFGARPLASKWDLAVLMTLIGDLTDVAVGAGGLDSFTLESQAAKDVLATYYKLLASIRFHQVENAHDVKPLLDGKEIAAALGIKPGPQIGRYLHHVMEWQLTHAHATKTQCIEYVQVRFGKGGQGVAASTSPTSQTSSTA